MKTVNARIGLRDRNVNQTSDNNRRSLLVDCICKQMKWFQKLWLAAPKMMKGRSNLQRNESDSESWKRPQSTKTIDRNFHTHPH
ncbi:hypothetical protein NPIL_177761 [Nephila pilipes]|uniref:Uncharacterized protein n=1 Tax=Nephila pilipes TaxID=299642 RepID=A0A8X6TM97_NEPPI|nr:hypothetical protein NPIL_177761 [Nephila pilipes]